MGRGRGFVVVRWQQELVEPAWTPTQRDLRMNEEPVIGHYFHRLTLLQHAFDCSAQQLRRLAALRAG